MGFIGGPLDGQPVTPDTLAQGEQAGAVNLEELLAGMPPGAAPAGPAPAPAGALGGLPPAPPGAAAGIGGPPSSPEGEEDLSEGARLDRILADMLSVAGGGELSEQSKASIQQAMTLVQKIKAQEEKESEAAIGGKLSPRLLSKAYGG